MLKRTVVGIVVEAGLIFGLLPGHTYAQAPSSEDAAIVQIQRLTAIGESDQRRIAGWVQDRIDELREAVRQDPNAAFKQFRDRVKSLYADSSNTREFRAQLAIQTAQIAEHKLANTALNPVVARALARVLVDMDRAETYPG